MYAPYQPLTISMLEKLSTRYHFKVKAIIYLSNVFLSVQR